MLAWLPECGCTFTWSAPKSCLGALYGKLLDFISEFASTVIALSRIPFGIFIGEYGALGVHNSPARIILGGYQKDFFPFPVFLA